MDKKNLGGDSIAAWVATVQQQRAIAVIRSPNLGLGRRMAEAVIAGGLSLIEVTWSSVEPVRLIEDLRQRHPHCWIGAGTLLTQQDMQDAIAAGSQFLFSPHVNPDLIAQAVSQAIPVIPGALTPTEIVTAWQAGATCIKVFPIQAVGGAEYIRSLQGPLGQIPLIPTGGVTLDNARRMLDAGAIAVGLSGQLFPKEAIAQQDWGQITERVRCLMQRLHSPIA
jgi:2-dehydro-3-deoxyphosphogluconate aldolase/(4S)-4-hydroxy-2-oxoglutarate aldolase